jgi:hypothetical protein
VSETWLTYSDLAKSLGISPEAVRQKAIRGRWPRKRGDDGKALVLVDAEAATGKRASDPAANPANEVSSANADLATRLTRSVAGTNGAARPNQSSTTAGRPSLVTSAISGDVAVLHADDPPAAVTVETMAALPNGIGAALVPEAPAAHPDRGGLSAPATSETTAIASDVVALKNDIARVEAVADQRCADLEAAYRRLDEMVADLLALSKRVAEQAASADQARAELAAFHTLPWWKRIAALRR